MRKFVLKSMIAVTLLTGVTETIIYINTPTVEAKTITKKTIQKANKALKKKHSKRIKDSLLVNLIKMEIQPTMERLTKNMIMLHTLRVLHINQVEPLKSK